MLHKLLISQNILFPRRFAAASLCCGWLCTCSTEVYGKVNRGAECLAFAQARLLSIHPFEDFNGRLTRVLLADLLHRLDMPALERRRIRPGHPTLSASAPGRRSGRLGAVGRDLARAV